MPFWRKDKTFYLTKEPKKKKGSAFARYYYMQDANTRQKRALSTCGVQRLGVSVEIVLVLVFLLFCVCVYMLRVFIYNLFVHTHNANI